MPMEIKNHEGIPHLCSDSPWKVGTNAGGGGDQKRKGGLEVSSRKKSGMIRGNIPARTHTGGYGREIGNP